jgi:hypothetical protein
MFQSSIVSTGELVLFYNKYIINHLIILIAVASAQLVTSSDSHSSIVSKLDIYTDYKYMNINKSRSLSNNYISAFLTICHFFL